MSHGLTIAELLRAARLAVEQCEAGGVAAKDGSRATGYLAGVEAAVECIDARAFDIGLTDHSDEMIEEHLKRIGAK